MAAFEQKPPAAKKGKHITTHEESQRGIFLAQFGLKPFVNPWINRKGPKESVGEDEFA